MLKSFTIRTSVWKRICQATLLAIPFVASVSGTAQAQIAAPTTSASTNSAVLPDDAGATFTIPLFAGQTRLVTPPWPVKRLAVSNPAVADVKAVSPEQVQLVAISAGMTDVTMWSADEEVWRARVEVERDFSKLEQQLTKLFPRAELEISQVGDLVAISGQFPRSEQALQMRQFLERSGMRYLDLTRVAGVQQVQLKVRVAEVSRTALKALGVNMLQMGNDFFGGVQIGSAASPLVPMNIGVPEGGIPGAAGFQALADVGVPPAVTLFGGFPNADLEIFIQALAENQYFRTLAEPTLVAISGQEASFLAGGEFPVPIAQLGEGGTTAISIEYREFGVRLMFKPVVLGDSLMRLEVVPEVSELSDVGAVEVLGTRVPSLLTRRVSTTLEMASGQTFGIAGLIGSTTSARTSRVPGLGDLPVLGTLFRSVRYSTSETELVILVTASLVEPQSTRIESITLPGATTPAPTAWELYALGRIEGQTTPKLAPTEAKRLRDLGLDQLRGPGAWASYEPAPADAKKGSQKSGGAK